MARVVLLPLLAPVFVLAYGVLFLSTAPNSTNTYIPYALVAGPMALLGFFLLGFKTKLLWVLLAGTYVLYLAYGLMFRAWASRGTSIGPLLIWIGVVHAACGMAFMYLSIGR